MKSEVRDTSEMNPESGFVVTDAGHESICLRKLVREAIPLLADPGGFPDLEYRRLANALKGALEGEDTEAELQATDDLDAGTHDEGSVSNDTSAPWQ